MAKFVMEIEISKDVADKIHKYMQQTTDGKWGFFEVLQENIDDVVRSLDKNGSAKIVEVLYD